jgi:hypothetical protein
MVFSVEEYILKVVAYVHVGNREINFERRRREREKFDRFCQFRANTTTRNRHVRPNVLGDKNFGRRVIAIVV